MKGFLLDENLPMRLSAFFGITPGLWMNLQPDYEFMHADREKGEAIR